MRRIWTRLFLTNKRLFRHPGFLAVLLAVPALVFALRLASGGDKGLVTIALALPAEAEESTRELVQRITDRQSLLRYLVLTEEEAEACVLGGEASAAWIFPESIEARLREAAGKGYPEECVTVLQREENVQLFLAREVLSSALLPDYAYAAYAAFARKRLGASLSDAELSDAYEAASVRGQILRIAVLDDAQEEILEGNDYLVSPLRGMLAIWLVLCGFVGILLCMQDERDGVYDCFSPRRKLQRLAELSCVLLVDGGIVFLAACRAAGIWMGTWRELAALAFLLADIYVFTGICRKLFWTPERLGRVIPFLLVLMLVLCPVFFSFRRWYPLKLLLPPFLYLQAIYSASDMWKQVLYAGIGGAILAVSNLCNLETKLVSCYNAFRYGNSGKA